VNCMYSRLPHEVHCAFVKLPHRNGQVEARRAGSH
jgi:hypothetical protein